VTFSPCPGWRRHCILCLRHATASLGASCGAGSKNQGWRIRADAFCRHVCALSKGRRHVRQPHGCATRDCFSWGFADRRPMGTDMKNDVCATPAATQKVTPSQHNRFQILDIFRAVGPRSAPLPLPPIRARLSVAAGSGRDTTSLAVGETYGKRHPKVFNPTP